VESVLHQAEKLLSRKAVAERWSCSNETVKRRTREGILHPISFNRRLIRYRLSEILAVEKAATQT
jgi:hypothetical protein